MTRNAVFFAAFALLGATHYSVVGRFPVPGTGGWDYVTLDSHVPRRCGP